MSDKLTPKQIAEEINYYIYEKWNTIPDDKTVIKDLISILSHLECPKCQQILKIEKKPDTEGLTFDCGDSWDNGLDGGFNNLLQEVHSIIKEQSK